MSRPLTLAVLLPVLALSGCGLTPEDGVTLNNALNAAALVAIAVLGLLLVRSERARRRAAAEHTRASYRFPSRDVVWAFRPTPDRTDGTLVSTDVDERVAGYYPGELVDSSILEWDKGTDPPNAYRDLLRHPRAVTFLNRFPGKDGQTLVWRIECAPQPDGTIACRKVADVTDEYTLIDKLIAEVKRERANAALADRAVRQIGSNLTARNESRLPSRSDA